MGAITLSFVSESEVKLLLQWIGFVHMLINIISIISNFSLTPLCVFPVAESTFQVKLSMQRVLAFCQQKACSWPKHMSCNYQQQ